jgi:hypothetical protein
MPAKTMDIGLQPDVNGELIFTGSNTYGPNVVITLPLVQFAPSAPVGFIGDEYALMELEGEVLADPATGSFGTLVHPDDALTSPSSLGYYVGAGVVTWKGEADATARDVGNVNVFEVNPTVERLDHWNRRVGIRRKDFAPVVQQSFTVRIVMDEFTYANLKMAMLAADGP